MPHPHRILEKAFAHARLLRRDPERLAKGFPQLTNPTLFELACRVARQGVPVWLVSTAEAATIDPKWLRQHAGVLRGLVGA